MRVRRQPYIPSLIRLNEIVRLDKAMDEDSGDDPWGQGGSLSDYLPSPEPPEDPNEIASTELFAILTPGNERVCVVLRADGYTSKSVSEITGLSQSQIRGVLAGVRVKVTPLKGKGG